MVYYLELGDYCRIAGEVLGLDPEQIAELPNIGLADSALAVPRAGFGDHEAFPTLIEKAAILVERLVPCPVTFARFWRRHRRAWQGRRPEGVAAPRRAVEDAARRGEVQPERANVA